jgi:aminoglycoside phosphotransferase family enzyme
MRVQAADDRGAIRRASAGCEPCPGPGLAEKVRFLSEGAHLEQPGVPVEVVETHFAWVFLTPTHAYKLRKPIRYHGIDTLSLAAREVTCREEVRLNQALAPGTYLDVLPLAATPDRELKLGGAAGEIVDWLVLMRRLPAARMLETLVRRGGLDATDLDALLRHLWDFYTGQPPIARDGAAYCLRLGEDIDCNREAVEAVQVAGLAAGAAADLAASQHALLDRLRLSLHARAEGGCIRECHGDLRPEHIFLGPPIVILDRLDFDRELRLLDPLEELTFLALECDRIGLPAQRFDLQRHAPAALRGAPPLLDFYRSNRAFTRARLAAWHLAEAGDKPAILSARVCDYMHRAAEAIAPPR